MKKLLQKTKRGGASMFVVMFTVIILSIITLGFTRLIISEATKTTNTDLSQSAYDSALAGVEDAKMALLQYHKCLDQGYRNKGAAATEKCEQIIYQMQEGIRTYDCSTVSNVLKREANESTEYSVVVQETQDSDALGNNTAMAQAYTCVTIKEDLEDYRTTLNSSNRLRIIPIRSSQIDTIDKIKIRWFSKVNYNIANKANNTAKSWSVCGSGLYPLGKDCHGKQQVPTTLTARLIQTDEKFDLSELSVSKDKDQTNTGQLTFYPKSSLGVNALPIKETTSKCDEDNGDNWFCENVWGESANKGENKLTTVKCKENAEWACEVDIDLPKTFNNNSSRSDANTYLLVSIPYGDPETDISIQEFSNGTRHDFTGVQARIDSTGRANDLYRRVETRVELVDTYFSYPEFEITMRGGSNSSIVKSFYATYDCWGADDGSDWDCKNSREEYNFAGD